MQKEKEELMQEYRDTLHRIAISTELLELDTHYGAAYETIQNLSAMKLINLKEEQEMKTTVDVFHWKTVNRIVEEADE